MTSILALDSSTNACSVAVWVDGVIIAARWKEMMRGHAESLVPMVADVTDEARCPVKDINLVAVTIGPGAFTGVRIGLAAARGFALSSGAPCLGLTSLEVIAAAVYAPPSRVLVVLDSKRQDVYFQIFDSSGMPCNEASISTLAQIGGIVANYISGGVPITLAGDAAPIVGERLTENGISVKISDSRYPHAKNLAELAASKWSPIDPVKPPSPIYLRSPDAVLPISGGRLRP